MILAADIGGTKADLALFALDGSRLVEVRHERHATAEAKALEPLLERFLGPDRGRVTACAVGVAGPVREGRVIGTNLAWTVEATSVARAIGLDSIALLNDLEAVAWGLPSVDPVQLRTIHPGAAHPHGTIAILAPGTGLGQAALVRDGHGVPHALATEGGHADFAARTELEFELARWIAARHEDHCSCERVLSGLGLGHVYDFLRATGRHDEPADLAAARAAGDPNAALSAFDGKAAIATATLDLFCEALGAHAGNLALTLMATGGVYLAGGIPPKIVDRLADGRFVNAFRAKGRLASLVASIPVHVVLDKRIALRGAAHVAARTLGATATAKHS